MPEKMNPVLFKIGGFAIQYYGLMYIVGLVITYLLARYRLRRESGRFDITIEELQNSIMAMFIGLIVGARLGYVLFYNFQYYIQHPLQIILPFDIANGWRFIGIAGLSFHGGLIGLSIVGFLYMRRHGIQFRQLVDLAVPGAALGYTFGRLGNFINGELYGRITESAIGMYFPTAPGPELRHPSQLYEAFFEGVVLFVILWILRNKMKTPGAMFPMHSIGYGVFRFFIEYARQPDEHLGFVLFKLSMGQVLCGLMIIAGVLIWWLFHRYYLYELEIEKNPKKRRRKK